VTTELLAHRHHLGLPRDQSDLVLVLERIERLVPLVGRRLAERLWVIASRLADDLRHESIFLVSFESAGKAEPGGNKAYISCS
jgi:hypothetical protein